MINLQNISHHYHLGKSSILALNNISLAISEQEMVAITGASGSGKSTLLNVIGCLLTPEKGTLTLLNKPIKSLTDNQKSQFRRDNIGFIFQSFNLLPILSVYENIEYPLILQKIKRNIRKKQVLELISQVGLLKFQNHKPDQLSGGQRQRVAIARALVTGPKYVLADEPTANLDSKTAETILKLIADINVSRGTAFILATHDAVVYNSAQRIIKMSDGSIV